VQARYPNKLIVHAPSARRGTMLFALQELRNLLPKVIVKGIPTVSRAVVNSLPKGGGYNLLVEGTDLQAVMGVEGVDGAETTSNHIFEAEKFLGIEAARFSIIKEIQGVMGSHGMSIDSRHCMLLADVMTYKVSSLAIGGSVSDLTCDWWIGQ
jgi:DNA-directed RNA polymerase III subunit RPC1